MDRMKRNAMSELMRWKESKFRKPLVIRGARQVGKTWLMKEFGSNNFDEVAYINFENNPRMARLFQDDFDVDRIILGLQIETGMNISKNSLIIFDEIQEVPMALTALKYFSENAPEYFVLAAGSSLGVAMHEGFSFPVGKVDFLNLHPLTFQEFLDATGNRQLVDLIMTKEFNLIGVFSTKVMDLLKQYFFVGGMPEAVLVYSDTGDFNQVRNVHHRLLVAYELDFSKHVPNLVLPRLRQAWHSIPAQLAKENKKFIYGLVKEGARAREYEMALVWLLGMGLVKKVYRITKPAIPLSAYQDQNAFKLFMLDVGLLCTFSNLDARSLLEGNLIFEEFKGALTEQYVFQELIASRVQELFYWSADKGIAEVDFIFQNDNRITPLEVKAGENLRSKSLKSYYERFQPEKSVRTSMADFRDEGWLINIPLYAIGTLPTFQ
jgi:predicted AAA+ superfamily ATPase